MTLEKKKDKNKMGNSMETDFKNASKVFTGTFGPNGTFDVLFRVKMITGIKNQIDSLL